MAQLVLKRKSSSNYADTFEIENKLFKYCYNKEALEQVINNSKKK